MRETIGRRELLGGVATLGLAAAVSGAASAQGESKKKKIIAVCCSERKGKTTAAALELCLAAACEQAPDIETELIELAGLSIPARLAAGLPLREGEEDDFPRIAEKLADPAVVGILVGSPTYFSNMSALCKAFLERCITFRKDGFTLRNKVAGMVAVGGTRNGGQELVVQSIEAGLMGQDLIIVGTGKPAGRFGATLWNQEDSIEQDDFGKGLASCLGRRVAEVAMALHEKA